MDSATGLTQAGLTGLHAVAGRHVGDQQVPGLVALVARGDQVHVEALRSLAVGGPPVARDSVFRIASTTTPITAAVTLAVAAEGLIGLDEPVDRLLPELAACRGSVTGRPGLVSTADDLLAFARMLLRGGAPVLPADAVRAMTSDQLTRRRRLMGAFCRGSSTAGRGGSASRSTTAARSAGTAAWAPPGWSTRPGT